MRTLRFSHLKPCVLCIGRRLAHGGTAGFQRRIVDDELDEVFPEIAAISLDGPKAVGKTTAAGQRARAVVRLDEWDRQTLVRASPSMILDHPRLCRRRIDHRLVHADPRCCDSWADGQTLSRGCGRVPRRAHRAVAPGLVADVGPGRQRPQPPRRQAETPLGGPGAVGPPARAGLPGAAHRSRTGDEPRCGSRPRRLVRSAGDAECPRFRPDRRGGGPERGCGRIIPTCG